MFLTQSELKLLSCYTVSSDLSDSLTQRENSTVGEFTLVRKTVMVKIFQVCNSSDAGALYIPVNVLISLLQISLFSVSDQH